MQFKAIIALLCAGTWCVTGESGGPPRPLPRQPSRHHKRGAFSGIPPYKLGHDFPVVTHSVLKPVVVSYPPTAVPINVKVPVAKYPVGVGERVPVPHPHHGLKFPHSMKTLFLAKPDHHFHHYHHHVPGKPVVAVVPAPPAPIVPAAVPGPQPTLPVVQPLPAPLPPPLFVEPNPIPPPAPVLPSNHINLKPFVQTPPVVQSSSPYVPFAPQYPYFIRPGGSIHESLFAHYPKYPLQSYSPPFVPATNPSIPINQVYLEHAQNPHYHLIQQAAGHDFGGQPPAVGLHQVQQAVGIPQVHQTIDVHQSQIPLGVPHFHQAIDAHQAQAPVGIPHLHQALAVHQPQPSADVPHLHQVVDLHQLQSATGASQVLQEVDVHQPHDTNGILISHDGSHSPDTAGAPVHHNHVEQGGWAPIPGDASAHGQSQLQAHEAHNFHRDQGAQVYEHQSEEQLFHEYRRQLEAQLERAQYEQQLQNQQNHNQHQLSQEYGTPHLNQETGSRQSSHEYGGPQNVHQQYGPPSQQFTSEYGLPQQAGDDFGLQDYGLSRQQLDEEYAEGRSRDSDDEDQPLRYHNHIPLGLQPPIDRPLEHFR